jgi:hypothetical protein
MHSECASCALRFEREPGFFLGAIYFNYGLTAVIAATTFILTTLVGRVNQRHLLWATMAFVAVFPLWFFRYARSLWLGFDEFMDPRDRDVQL